MKQPNNTMIYNTALYLRLSRDDELQGESGSIQTQRMMLRQYAEEHALTVVGEYIDDGWSGTNFDRPGFQRMIDDIEEGKINCVVTKDLSRLGRNYILTGQYTEIYFPSKGVRYIAVNDNVDTLNGESELAPFLNILNEMHARQTSKKVKAAMRTRFANGAHYGAYAPLGYIKDPEKSGHLLVDPETKWIIEKIFDLAVHGHGAASITHILVDEKVPTPGWLNFQRYGTFANIYAGASEEKSYYMMNILDYLVGNTDRHWENWGLLVDNETNQPIRLHDLMDFNRAFQQYDTLDGANCLTVGKRHLSQKAAAEEAVRKVGLNQVDELDDTAFAAHPEWGKALKKRLDILKTAAS